MALRLAQLGAEDGDGNSKFDGTDRSCVEGAALSIATSTDDPCTPGW